jgi:beta-galactosidase
MHSQHITYGAVYFRKSNPPRRDWKRDHAVAAEDGLNAFRHWFMWSAIQPGPDRWDWADFDEQFDLAEANGLGTVIAELTKTAPEWVFRRLPHTRYQRRAGTAVESGMFDSSAIGGNPGVCLDNEDARELAGQFLTRLVTRYRDRSSLIGYDVWNECNYEEDVCYCDATAERFRGWLAGKYGEPSALGAAWGRYVESFDDIVPPRGGYAYGDVLDWLEFRRDNAYRLMRWRIDLIRSLDPDHRIIAHGVAATLGHASSRGADDWRAAADVDLYGMTFVPARHGDEAWRQPLALDVTRSASRGKPFWHAELQGGPLWLQPQVVGRRRDDGRIASPEDIRYWNLASLAHGASGVFYLRWRPLLNGPLFGAFGPYGMDGERTDRSAAVADMAAWVNDPRRSELWRHQPRRGDIGILVVPESQDLAYAQHLSAATGAGLPNHWVSASEYHDAAAGAWRAFFDSGIRADFVHIDDLDSADHETMYLPYPLMLNDSTVDRLRGWVANGGSLISEGCPGYFADNGWAQPRQPARGLDEVFGATELDVEFVPDLLHHARLSTPAGAVRVGGNRQWYSATTGTVAGTHDDGRPGAVENSWGRGRALLLGSHPGIGYARHGDEASRAVFAWLLDWAGRRSQTTVSDPDLIVRLHETGSSLAVWVLNPTRTRREATVSIRDGVDTSTRPSAHRGAPDSVRRVGTGQFAVNVPARDAAVFVVADGRSDA